MLKLYVSHPEPDILECEVKWVLGSESESKSHSAVSNSLQPPWTIQPWILQAIILEWVAYPFSRGSSQPSTQTQVSHIAGRFFISWATREAQEYWSG